MRQFYDATLEALATSPFLLAMPVPAEIRTPRFVLRRWCAEDARALLPVLEANFAHLSPWIPARVATPVPLPMLAARLAGFGNDFATAKEWRYGLFSPDETTVLGEAGIYPRAASGRVAYADATHVELGYWLRADETGKGLVTEATKLLLDIVATLDRVSHVEIRCDARNAPSAAIPRRLGFRLATTISEASKPEIDLQVWTLDLPY
jgi:RimJ/RimL family protein N-acetyltransferase